MEFVKSLNNKTINEENNNKNGRLKAKQLVYRVIKCTWMCVLMGAGWGQKCAVIRLMSGCTDTQFHITAVQPLFFFGIYSFKTIYLMFYHKRHCFFCFFLNITLCLLWILWQTFKQVWTGATKDWENVWKGQLWKTHSFTSVFNFIWYPGQKGKIFRCFQAAL